MVNTVKPKWCQTKLREANWIFFYPTSGKTEPGWYADHDLNMKCGEVSNRIEGVERGIRVCSTCAIKWGAIW